MTTPPLFKPAVVAAVSRPSHQVVAISLAGDALRGVASTGPAEHFRLFFPEQNGPMPAGTPGQWQLAEGQPPPNSRSYTPVKIDGDAGTIDFLVILHGSGVGAGWAERATVGDGVLVAGPSRPYAVDPRAARHLIAGDAAALPAISTILAALPEGAEGRVIVETTDAAQRIALAAPAAMRVDWLDGDEAAPDAALEAAVTAAAPGPETAIWIACEAAAMRRLRRQLLEGGHPKDQLVTRGYWRLQTPNHPDSDYGEADL